MRGELCEDSPPSHWSGARALLVRAESPAGPDEFSVLDAKLRVYGMNDLRIADG
jgi:hypothetical protein